MKPKYDVCLITRNEAKVLPRLLSSLEEFKARGGQVNVCDTGSTDETVKIAKEWGCNVKEVGEKYRHTISPDEATAINDRFIIEDEPNVVEAGESYFDFASARNDAVSMARENWICTVDADEVFTRMDIDKINEILENEKLGQLEYNFVFSHDQYGNELVKFIQSKFYHRKKMEWVGIIHEMVTPIQGVREPMDRILLDENTFKLEHWQNEETNRTGYLKGLAVDCFEHQEKDRNSHYFARELWWNGRSFSAAKEFVRHINMNGWAAERAESMLFLSDICGAMAGVQQDKENIQNTGSSDMNKIDWSVSSSELLERQMYWCHRALDIEPNRREPLIKLAQIHQRHKEPIPANFYATAALELPWYPFYGANKRFYENEPHEILYWAKGWIGDIPGAQKHLLKCLEYMPYNPKYLEDTQYYFDYKDQGIEGWMRFPELTFLNTVSKKMESVLEVGSWKGRSTHAILSGCPGTVTTVDTFAGSQDERDETLELAKREDIYETFLKNVGTFPNLKVMKMTSAEAAEQVPDHSVDMVFIDAEHTYEGAKNDIRAWKDKANIVLCGHDYGEGWPGVIKAVDTELGGPDEVHDSIWVKWLKKPKVSICIPTIRPEKIHQLVAKIKETAEYDNYEIVVKMDQPIPNNEGAPKVMAKCVADSTGELILFLGDDVVPQQGFLREAVWQMLRKFPQLDGMIGLNDGYWQEHHVAPHFLISRKLVDEHLEGEVFHTGYNHTGCDNELRARVEMLDKYAWAEKARIFHNNPMMMGLEGVTNPVDAVYEQAYQGPRHEADDKLYAKRAKKYGFQDRKWV